MKKSTTVLCVVMQNIEVLRTMKGWKVPETATRLHISTASYNNYRSGRNTPPITFVDSAARVFGLTPAQVCTPIELENLLNERTQK